MTAAQTRVTYFFLGVYALLMLVNLHHLPLPWIDEVGYLDPAWNAVKNGQFASNLWPHQGADQLFMAHLPVLQWVNMVSAWLLPNTVWFARLLPMLLFLLAGWWWINIAKNVGIQWWWLFALLLLCDRSVFEAARSMRMEGLELLWFGGMILFRKKHPIIPGLLTGLLVMTHPKVWAIGLVFGMYYIVTQRNWARTIGFIAGAVLPFIVYLIQIGGDVSGWYDQLVSHGSDHTIGTVPGNRFVNHFLGRYLLYDPVSRDFSWYYRFQPYVPVVQWIALFWAIRNVATKRQMHEVEKILSWTLIAHHIYSFFLVGPFQKYNTIALAMGYVLFLLAMENRIRCAFNARRKVAIGWVMVLVISTPVLLRHTVALVEWKERDVAAFNDWLFNEIDPKPNEKILIIECASAYYETRQRDSIDFQFQFFLFNNSYKNYDRVFYVTHKRLEVDVVNEYSVSSSVKSLVPTALHGLTHDGIKIYDLNEEDYVSLIEFDRMK